MNRYLRGLSLCLFVLALFVLFGSPAFTQAPGAGGGQSAPPGRDVVDGREVVAGEVLVKFRTPQTASERGLTQQQVNADRDEEIGGLGVRRLHSRAFDTRALLAFFRALPNVEYVEPNDILQALATPNDPSFPQLWGLSNPNGADIHAVPAWDVSTGSRNNVVAVVDTGVDYNHPDLAANIWSAPSAFTVHIGISNITCAAGTHGFNAIKKTCDPMDDNNHGTHVSGTIGAVGNNGEGVAGVNWTASIMGTKFLGASGSGSTADAINAIEFAIQAKTAFASINGANVRVLSNSWGGGGFSQSLLNEINRANSNDMLFVAAAGNASSNNDSTPSYPASYNAANIVAVAATDSNDTLAYFSNYGTSSVHLGAPGVGILSTTRNGGYQSFSGTSMATPHVSGAALLLLSVCPLDTAGLKNTLLANVDDIGLPVSTHGRLNVDKAIRACAPGGTPQPVPPAAPTGLTATPGNNLVNLAWNAAAGADSYNVKRRLSSDNIFTTITPAGWTATSYLDQGAQNGNSYVYVVSAVNGAGEGPDSNPTPVVTPSAPPVSQVPATPGKPTASPGPGAKKLTVSWGPVTGATSYTLKRSVNGGSWVTLVSGVTSSSYANTGLTVGSSYQYTVSAQNSSGTSGDSPASDSVIVTR